MVIIIQMVVLLECKITLQKSAQGYMECQPYIFSIKTDMSPTLGSLQRKVFKFKILGSKWISSYIPA